MNKLVCAIFVALTLFAHPALASRSAEGRGMSSEKPMNTSRTESRAAAASARETRELSARTTTTSRTATQPNLSPRGLTTGSRPNMSSRATAAGSRPNVSRAANISRSMTVSRGANVARSGSSPRAQIGKISAPVVGGKTFARSAEALGSDYSRCRDSYSACMDQFCAAASETYKKCICSDKYLNLAAQKEALESAENALQDFGTLNMNMIQMTASQVNAALSATEGESAMKEDTSANAQKLNDILGSLGSSGGGTKGKTGTKLSASASSSSFSFDLDDIWGGGTSEGAIGENVRGRALFTQVNSQCQQMTKDSCKGTNVGMVVSAYQLTIDSDCQKFQIAIDKMRQGVRDKIRQANVAMMNERLSDFENRNSQSAIECLQNVLNDFRKDAVCGGNWERCLDMTGKFINQKGEPIYSPEFTNEETGLTSLIVFGDGSQTILEANKGRSGAGGIIKFLDEKKNFAGDSLKSCEQDAAKVWTEAQNRALMEIAQAQVRKVEEVKDNCITKLVECNTKQMEQMDKLLGTDDSGSSGSSATGGGSNQPKSLASSALTSAEACKGIQQSCEAIYDSNTLNALLEDRVNDLIRRRCEEERGGYWHNLNSTVARGAEEKFNGICITTQNECVSNGLYWVLQEGNINVFQKNAIAALTPAEGQVRSPQMRKCISFEYYCGNFEAAGVRASSGPAGKPTPEETRNGNVCGTVTQAECTRNGFPWIGGRCIRDRYDCDTAGTGIIWYAGRCWASIALAQSAICKDLGGYISSGTCITWVKHKKP